MSLSLMNLGQRVCGPAWEWEKQHRESRQEKRIATNSPVVFRLFSGGPATGNGFKAHFNEFRPTSEEILIEFLVFINIEV